MTERELLELWNKNRQQIVVSQMAPTFLLIVTVGLITLGLSEGSLFLSFATLGILLASGILGALVQYSSATEAMAVATDLAHITSPSATSRQVIKFAPWLNVVRFVTPTIFTLIFLFLASILLIG
jgi:hypothetical protein